MYELCDHTNRVVQEQDFVNLQSHVDNSFKTCDMGMYVFVVCCHGKHGTMNRKMK